MAAHVHVYLVPSMYMYVPTCLVCHMSMSMYMYVQVNYSIVVLPGSPEVHSIHTYAPNVICTLSR